LQTSRLTSHGRVKAEVLAYLETVETRKEARSGAVPVDAKSLAKDTGKEITIREKAKVSTGKNRGKGTFANWSNKSSSKDSWNIMESAVVAETAHE